MFLGKSVTKDPETNTYFSRSVVGEYKVNCNRFKGNEKSSIHKPLNTDHFTTLSRTQTEEKWLGVRLKLSRTRKLEKNMQNKLGKGNTASRLQKVKCYLFKLHQTTEESLVKLEYLDLNTAFFLKFQRH